jgi:hypothetical protein
VSVTFGSGIVSQLSSPAGQMTPLEEVAMLQVALRHAMIAEAYLSVTGANLSTVACTGALILSRMAYHVQSRVPDGTIQPFRELAHTMLDEVLDEVELMFREPEGRA